MFTFNTCLNGQGINVICLALEMAKWPSSMGQFASPPQKIKLDQSFQPVNLILPGMPIPLT